MIDATRLPGARDAGLLAVIFAGALAAPWFSLGGVHLSGDRLIGLTAVAGLGFLIVRGDIRWTRVHLALAVFTAVQLLTSLLAAGAWQSGPRLASIYVLGFACFAITADRARGRDGAHRGARFWMGLGAVLGYAGTLVALAANVAQVMLWGTGLCQLIRAPGRRPLGVFAAKVTFNEWNLYSSFLLVAFALALWAWPRDRREGAGARAFAAVAGITLGLVFGLTRAAWLAMAAIAAYWLWARRPPRRQVAALALVVAVGLSMQALSLGSSPVRSRVVTPLETGQDRNLSVRVAVSQQTIRSWLRHPVLGNGAGSINGLHVEIPNVGPNYKPWDGNLVLFVLHDSGLVGLCALVGLIVVIAVSARRALASPEARAGEFPLVPLLVAGVALIWAYQFTHALWLMYPYVYLGLLTASMGEAARLG